MPDYQKMYLMMFRASEKAINLLIAAQQACEELYIKDSSPGLKITVPQTDSNKNKSQ